MVFKIVVFIIIAIILFVTYCAIENRKFRVTRYEYVTDKVSRDLTLAVISDMHNYSYGEQNSRLFEAIEKENPDIVVSAGDIVTASRHTAGTKESVDFLQRISKKFTFVYGCGNHERKLLWDNDGKFPEATSLFKEALEEVKAQEKDLMPLDNTTRDFPEENIRFYGLNLPGRYFRRRDPLVLTKELMNGWIGTPDPGMLNILLGHDPDHFEVYADWGADLVLSGHVHGGMVATPWGRGIISPKLTLLPKYDRGVFRSGKTTMILSGGMGNHTVHVRIFNRAELLIIRIKHGNIGKA